MHPLPPPLFPLPSGVFVFDTHCHGFWKELAEHASEVQQNMQTLGVRATIQIGTSIEDTYRALRTAESYGKNHWATAGIHPVDCQDLAEDRISQSLQELEEMITKNPSRFVAIGEVGLDYYHLSSNPDLQKHRQELFFRAQVRLAQKLRLPLVIHTRNAARDTLNLLQEEGAQKVLFHCFSEDEDFAQKALRVIPECFFGFWGVLTYPKSVHVRRAAQIIPLDRIVLETDAPFLVPQVLRKTHKICEPGYTRYILDALIQIRPEGVGQVAQAVWNNACRFFSVQPEV